MLTLLINFGITHDVNLIIFIYNKIYKGALILFTPMDIRYKDYKWLYLIIIIVIITHSCNPIYSRGRDQEDYGLKSAWVNSS
jgi:hypothetical protein